MIAKFSKSHVATKALYIQTGRKLLFPANTRWSSLQITYKRLLEVFDEVNGVCNSEEFRWETISERDKDFISHVVNIVDPFRKFTDILQQDSQPTLSRLYPGLLELRAKIQVQFSCFLFTKNLLFVALLIIYDLYFWISRTAVRNCPKLARTWSFR